MEESDCIFKFKKEKLEFPPLFLLAVTLVPQMFIWDVNPRISHRARHEK